jgi:nitroreductase
MDGEHMLAEGRLLAIQGAADSPASPPIPEAFREVIEGLDLPFNGINKTPGATTRARNTEAGWKRREGMSSANGKVSVYHAIYRRRMAWRFKEDAVRKSAVEQMLDAAVWAPNHRLTEPWRFFVLEKGGDIRRKVAELAYEFSIQRNNDPTRAEKARQSVLEPPIVIYVYCLPGPTEEVTQENYAAVCCAAQNISLAGVAEGLAVTWETGGPTRHPKLKKTLGAEDDWTMVTMLSIGVPAESPSSRRTPATEFTRWLG